MTILKILSVIMFAITMVLAVICIFAGDKPSAAVFLSLAILNKMDAYQ